MEEPTLCISLSFCHQILCDRVDEMKLSLFLSLSFKEHIRGLSLKCRATLLACTQFEKGHGDLKFELRF